MGLPYRRLELSRRARVIPVVMSGGSGERLWPISRTAFPKPFCSFFDESLMVKTLRRVSPLGTPLVLTTEHLKTLTQQCLHQCQLPLDSVLYEPCSRNTAPAIAWLCHHFKLQSRESEVVGIFPADQLVENEDQLIQLSQSAESLIQGGSVITLGIPPTHPATRFGYIEVSENNKVLRFHEKPELCVAEKYITYPNFFWNAGIFFFRVEGMMNNFTELMPELWQQIESLLPDGSNAKEIYDHISPLSFDHGIMEPLQSRLCLKADIGWSDLGYWEEVFNTKDLVKTRSQDVEVDAKNNRSFSLTEKTIGFLGVENLTVVDTPDALLICDTQKSSNMRELVSKVRAINPQSTEYHHWDTRPWGRYETLLHTDSEVVKKIWVNPGSKISYQFHDFREEHWIIVEGTGEVILNDETHPVQEGTYIHIPIRAKHRIINTSDKPLCFLEVQQGTRLIESDIHRCEDDFGR